MNLKIANSLYLANSKEKIFPPVSGYPFVETSGPLPKLLLASFLESSTQPIEIENFRKITRFFYSGSTGWVFLSTPSKFTPFARF